MCDHEHFGDETVTEETVTYPAKFRKPQSTHVLRRLAPKNMHHYFADIMENVCQYTFDIEYRPVPKRHEALKAFPVTQVRKKGQTGKKKSTQGYIWVETDTLSILTNKYRVRSCHTLDNTSMGYRSGNFNHAYNPYMATVFASAKGPLAEREAISSVTGDTLYLGGKPATMRDYQAVGNVFFMTDEQDRPYLFLSSRNGHNESSLYDSCPENPWDATVLRYFQTWCRYMGIGLVVDTSWETHCKAIHEYGEISHEAQCDVRYLRTPTFKLWDGQRLPGYADGTLSFEKIGGRITVSGHGYCVVKPRIRKWDGSLYPQGYASHCDELDGDDADNDDDETFHCHQCGNRTPDDYGYSDPNGYNMYCEECYSRNFAHCQDCEEDHDRDNMTQSPDGVLRCDTCHSAAYVTCDGSGCSEEIEREEAHNDPDGNALCETRWNEQCRVCAKCGTEHWEEDSHALTGSELCEDCYNEVVASAESRGEEPRFPRTVEQPTQTRLVLDGNDLYDAPQFAAMLVSDFGHTPERAETHAARQCNLPEPCFVLESSETPRESFVLQSTEGHTYGEEEPGQVTRQESPAYESIELRIFPQYTFPRAVQVWAEQNGQWEQIEACHTICYGLGLAGNYVEGDRVSIVTHRQSYDNSGNSYNERNMTFGPDQWWTREFAGYWTVCRGGTQMDQFPSLEAAQRWVRENATTGNATLWNLSQCFPLSCQCPSF